MTYRDKPLSTVLNHLNPHHIGVSDFFDDLFGNVKFDSITPKYPPRNIIKNDENNFTVEFALAGWSPDEIEVTQKKDVLYVSANREEIDETDNYIYKGISKKSFNVSFSLLSNLEVESADMKDGMLRVHIVRVVPEEEKPKMIEIKTA